MSSVNKDKKGAYKSIESESSLFSLITFSWLFDLIKLGHSRQLLESDISPNIDRDKVHEHVNKFETNLKKMKKKILFGQYGIHLVKEKV